MQEMALLMTLIVGCYVNVNSAMTCETVKHPNLLLNEKEIEQIRAKIRDYRWAENLFEKVKIKAENGSIRETAICYAVTGENHYADYVRQQLVNTARSSLSYYEKLDLRVEPEWGAWSEWGTWAWAYDLTYNTFSDDERKIVEQWLRKGCKIVIEGEKIRTTTPNLVFGKHFNVGLVGYCLGDKELIEWAFNDPGVYPNRGGFYQVLDTMLNDGYFWGETPIYALHYDIHGMLALAEAALHYDGTDLYNYVSKKSGGSIKSFIDGYIRLGYSLEKTGIGKGSMRMATYGDGATSYSPSGALYETFLVNPIDQSPGTPVLSGELELAYKRYKDPEYAWIISLNPNRDTYISYGRAALGYVALTHGEPLPKVISAPKAPSGVYTGQGFAFLRSDESPSYWTSGALSALVMLGKLIGHGHNDYYSLILHGKGRLLYPDLNVIQYEPTYLNWTHEGIAHNTLLVDFQSPKPGHFITKHDFNDDVKFFNISGTAFDNVNQSRILILTKEYLADFFYACDKDRKERTFDWILHGLGRLYPGNPASYKPTNALVPHYWWVDNEMGRKVDSNWQVDWIQNNAGITKGLQAFGDEWFEQEVGVRMTMLGINDSQVFYGDGPITDGPPYHRINGNDEGSSPIVVVRRKSSSTCFASIHEPYDNKPQIQKIERLVENESAIAIKITTEKFTDYVMVAYDDQEHTLSAQDGQAFTFADYGYIRSSINSLKAHGRLKAFRIKAQIGSNKIRINEEDEYIRQENEFVVFGSFPDKPEIIQTVDYMDNPIEHEAHLYYWFTPEEIHLSKSGDYQEKIVEVYSRCVGNGKVDGQMQVIAPDGIHVEPQSISIQSLGEGEKQSIPLKIMATGKVEKGIYYIKFVPENGLKAGEQSLLVSIGVVITTDRCVPKSAQFVIRAPGYMMKVDQYSGVSYYLLDADGHRRHGRIHNTNFIFGIPGIMRDEKWGFCFRHPCRFIWEGENTLTIGCDGTYNDHDLRMQYTFHENRIVIAITEPTNPTKEQTMWLGNFDAILPPKHNGKEESGKGIIADQFYFAHPIYRQGLLLIKPPDTALHYYGTAVNFPVKTGGEIVLQFIDENQWLSK